MTPQEAIEWLLGIENKYIHGGDEGFDENRKLAIKTAISALEKQIPKKPLDIEGDYTALYGGCPNCKNIVCDNEDYRFCNECGQALDWGDSE